MSEVPLYLAVHHSKTSLRNFKHVRLRCGFGFRVWGFGVWVLGLGLRVEVLFHFSIFILACCILVVNGAGGSAAAA